jgi:cellulose synthase (UDP-forming)
LRRRTGSFVVTPKRGAGGRQLRPVAPTLAVIAVLVAAAAYGLVKSRDAATLNNVAFAALHVAVLGHGVMAALVPSLATAATADAARREEAAA